MKVSVGFTGTRRGMTYAQAETVRNLIIDMGATDLHHGDCVGADAQAHYMASQNGTIRIFAHPMIGAGRYASNRDVDVRYPAKSAMDRNRDIVAFSDVVIAAPYLPDEQPRGGTWATIRFARGKCVVVLPSGQLRIR